MTRATRALLLAACASSCISVPEDPAPTVRGPLPSRIMQPVGLLFPGPEPRRATVQERGHTFARAEFAYASIYEVRNATDEAARFDGEIARTAIEVRHGLGDGLELTVEPTFLFATSGFLDRIIDEFHRLSGFVGGGRSNTERDQYVMEVERDGAIVYALEEDQPLLADLPITLTQSLRAEDADGPALAARLTIELPTGDEDRGSGSGGIDFAAGVVGERSIGRWTLFGSIDGVQTDDPDAFVDAGIEIRTLLLAGGGVEFRWSDRLSLLGQAVLQMPLTRSLRAEEIDREMLDLGIGLAYDIAPATVLYASFHEDAVAASGPDATLQFGVSVSR